METTEFNIDQLVTETKPPEQEVAPTTNIADLVPPVEQPTIPAATAQDILGEQPQPPQQDEQLEDWKCPCCGKPFEYRSQMVRHIEKVHAEQAATVIAALPPPSRRYKGKSSGTAQPNFQGNPPPPSFNDVPQIDKNPLQTVDFKSLASMIFDMTTGAACVTLGPEWKAKSEEEKNFVCSPLEAYLRAKEISDIPPGVLLAFAVAAYSATRIQEPSTMGKIKLGWQWLKNKFGKGKR